MEVADLPDLVLVFSFVGMETREIPYRGEEMLNIVLKDAVTEIGEVVVTGYQQIEKRQLTSAVSTIKTEDLNMVGASSIEDMLQGQLAGLSVVNTSAAAAHAPKIRVRGTATIAGNADPLWVLDGVMLENSVPITVAELNSPDVDADVQLRYRRSESQRHREYHSSERCFGNGDLRDEGSQWGDRGGHDKERKAERIQYLLSDTLQLSACVLLTGILT